MKMLLNATNSAENAIFATKVLKLSLKILYTPLEEKADKCLSRSTAETNCTASLSP